MKISVILCTYNRSDLLPEAARSILAQPAPTTDGYELIIVDNNSTDDTRKAVEKLRADFPDRVRYLFEPRQGRSFALNTGIREAKGEIVLFTDDDILAEPDWLASIHRAFETSAAEGVGGRVCPNWEAERPSWLVEELYGTLGLIDYGAEAGWLDDDRLPIGCNVAFRRGVFDRIGLYNTALGRKGEALFSSEDDEFCRRLLRAGGRIYYEPAAVIVHRVPVYRLKKRYFRRWHRFTGMSDARVHDPDVVYLMNVPRYFFRRLLDCLARWAWFGMTGRWHRAFGEELFFWYFGGYLMTRWKTRGSE